MKQKKKKAKVEPKVQIQVTDMSELNKSKPYVITSAKQFKKVFGAPQKLTRTATHFKSAIGQLEREQIQLDALERIRKIAVDANLCVKQIEKSMAFEIDCAGKSTKNKCKKCFNSNLYLEKQRYKYKPIFT